MLARISSADFVHTNGRAAVLCWSRNSRDAESTMRTQGAACWSRQLEAERMLRSLRNNRNGVTNDATDRLAEMMRLRLTTWNGEMVGAILDRAESDSAAWTALTQAAELRAFALTQEDRDAALEEARDRYEAALAPVEEINMEITAAMAVIEKRIDELTSSSRRE